MKNLPADQHIIEEYNSGTLLSRIFGGLSDDDQDLELPTQLAELHNSGQINVLSLVEQPEFQSLGGVSFFEGQHVFCKLIPLLKCEACELVSVVRKLVSMGGNDLAAGFPNAAFREWCSVSFHRSEHVIKLAKSGDQAALDCLTFALEAHEMVDIAADFASSETGQRQRAGVVALGRIPLREPDQVKKAIAAMRSAAQTDADDILRANILRSSVQLIESNSDAQITDISDLLDELSPNPGDQFQYACASVLFFHSDILNERTIRLLLRSLMTLNPDHKGTISELDNGLHAVLKTKYDQIAIQFVREFLLANHGRCSLSDFKRFSRELIHRPQKRFSEVFVSWLLTGERSLCEGLSLVLQGTEASQNNKAVVFSNYKLTSDQFLFLCRKTISYFFIQPVFIGNVIVSILRVCDNEASLRVRQLLIDPMLISYGGALRDYLETVAASDPAYEAVADALAKSKQYLEGLKSVGSIAEIMPSEREKMMELQRFSDQIRNAHKEAEKESVILNLVSRSVLLYGRGSVTYIRAPDGTRKAVETEMKSFSTSMELARQEVVDPIGLDLMLRIFRAEQMQR